MTVETVVSYLICFIGFNNSSVFFCNCRFVRNFVWFICGSSYFSRHTSTLEQACSLSDEPLGNLAQLLSIGMKERSGKLRAIQITTGL